MNYILHIATAALALLYLAKDWEGHKRSWRRLVVLSLILLIGIAGIINTHYTNKKIERQRNEDQVRIASLKEAVDTANKNQEDNTRQFINAFGNLSQKVNDLQTNVKTAGLREEAEKLKGELVSTQKALTPQKSALAFTFEKADIGDMEVLRTVTLPVKDGVVHVDFSMINPTNITSHAAEIAIRLCKDCEFAAEPDQFIKVAGQFSKLQRNRSFDRVFARSKTPTMTANIKVPSNASSVEFVVLSRCENCDVSIPETSVGVIRLSR